MTALETQSLGGNLRSDRRHSKTAALLSTAGLAALCLAGCGSHNADRTSTQSAAIARPGTNIKPTVYGCEAWIPTKVLPGETMTEVGLSLLEIDKSRSTNPDPLESTVRDCDRNETAFIKADPPSYELVADKTLYVPLSSADEASSFQAAIQNRVSNRVSTSNSNCPSYPLSTYGINPNVSADTGGGTQLVTVIESSTSSVRGAFVAWQQTANECWSPVSFSGQAEQPYIAETGLNGLKPFADRISGDHTTPMDTFGFGSEIYGLATQDPSKLYPYTHLQCGDWWDEQPGSSTFDSFQKVSCASTPPYAAYSEQLWKETEDYRDFIDIPMYDSSENQPAHLENVAGIFLHDNTASHVTEGCIAIPDNQLNAVLSWLNPADNPHILIGVRAS